MRLPASSAVALAALLAVPVAGAGCVTRTVYVVDDNPRRDPPPRTARADVQAPQDDFYDPGAYGAGGGGMYFEDEAGIRDASDFYEPLSPYGRWVSYPGYGMVWQPSVSVVGASFRPYTHGHWERTEFGWTWVDHHPFGWATGHYGRWFYDGSYGWVWVPGTTWAPAWVSWRSGGGYVGWAPMPPGAVFGGGYTVYDTSWVFVSYSSFGVSYVGSYMIVGAGYRTCYAATYPVQTTTVYYGRTYYTGPAEDEVARGGGRVIHRPAREVDRERPVTRPPEGTTISRGRERERPNGGGRGDDGGGRGDDGGGRGDDGGGRGDNGGNGNGLPRERDDRDRGHGNDPDRNDEDNPGRGNGRGPEPRPNPPGGNDRRDDDVRGRASMDFQPVGRDGLPDEPRDIPGRDDVVRPRDDRDIGPGRGSFEPRPTMIDDVEPRPIDPRPSFERPSFEQPGGRDERPDMRPDVRPDVRPDARPDFGRGRERGPVLDRAPNVAPNIDRSPVDRGPSMDRSPARTPSFDRGPAPSRPSGPSGPSVSRPAPQPQPSAQQPSSTPQESSKKATSKKDSGKGKSSGKTRAR